MKDPRIWFEDTVNHYEEEIRENPNFEEYSEDQVHNRALGETYNNWILRFRRRDGSITDAMSSKEIEDVEELVDALGVNRDELYDVLDRIDAHRSMSNPAMTDLDLLTREVLFAMAEQKGYDPRELVS